MLPKHIKNPTVGKVREIISGMAVLALLIAAIPIFLAGQTMFLGGGVVFVLVYIISLILIIRFPEYSSHVPDSRLDGFSHTVKQPYWFDIMVHAIRVNRSPIDSPGDLDIMYSPLSLDPDKFRSWANSGAWREALDLAEKHHQNPYSTADRLRFASWLLREVEGCPALLKQIDNPDALQPAED